MTRSAYLIAARRTPVAPRGGALSSLQADELAAPVLSALLKDAGLAPAAVDHVILGNALYAGGNPARLAALSAGVPMLVPAMTIDTQCCSGLDAILMGARLIEAGAANCVLAGGTESFSRAPIRMHRPLDQTEEPVPYERPPFAPPPFQDPDLAEAAARLARIHQVNGRAQAEFAVASHEKALRARDVQGSGLVAVTGEDRNDGFTRQLKVSTALRAPILAGDQDFGLTAATIACEADGAAAVLLVSERIWRECGLPGLRVVAGVSEGGDPADPALVPVSVAKTLLTISGLDMKDIGCVELMEAYAVQAMVTVKSLQIDERRLNVMGGALARGHPIGASGAILAVQLFQQMLRTQGNAGETADGPGLALIAAAGGLGSGLLVERAVYKGG